MLILLYLSSLRYLCCTIIITNSIKRCGRAHKYMSVYGYIVALLMVVAQFNRHLLIMAVNNLTLPQHNAEQDL